MAIEKLKRRFSQISIVRKSIISTTAVLSILLVTVSFYYSLKNQSSNVEFLSGTAESAIESFDKVAQLTYLMTNQSDDAVQTSICKTGKIEQIREHFSAFSIIAKNIETGHSVQICGTDEKFNIPWNSLPPVSLTVSKYSGDKHFDYLLTKFSAGKYQYAVLLLVTGKSLATYLQKFPWLRQFFILSLVGLFIAMILTYLLRFLGLMAKDLKSGKMSLDLRNVGPLQSGHDLLTINQSIYALNKNKSELETERDLYRDSHLITHALEIQQSEGNYPFKSMVVFLRLDMNNFSTKQEENPEGMQALLATLLIAIGELCLRHCALLYQEIGDEYIVAFKSPAYNDGRKAAAIFCRDFYGLIENELAHLDVTFKASISRSSTWLYRLSKFFLFSKGLTLTARYLDVLKGKTNNSLIIESDDSTELNGVLNYGEARVFELKGISSRELREVNSFISNHEIIYGTDKVLYRNLVSNKSIVDVLEAIVADRLTSNEKIDILTTIADNIKIFFVSDAVKTAWINAVSSIHNRASLELKLIATVLKFGAKIFENSKWEISDVEEFFLYESLKDSRVNANMILFLGVVLTYDDFEDAIAKIPFDSEWKSFRPQGDILIRRAKSNLNSNIFNELKDRLESKNHMELATAIYTTAEILKFWKVKDFSRLGPFIAEITAVIDAIVRLSNHPNKIVSDRAITEINELRKHKVNEWIKLG